jgi:hypothetical protein
MTKDAFIGCVIRKQVFLRYFLAMIRSKAGPENMARASQVGQPWRTVVGQRLNGLP